MHSRLEKMLKICKAATPGPWWWRLNRKSKQVVLESGGRGRWLERVMDFVRYGMGGAKPRFLDQEKCLMVDADKLGVDVPGREHHSEWAQTLAHPDAEFIAESRSELECYTELLIEIDRWCDVQGAASSEPGASDWDSGHAWATDTLRGIIDKHLGKGRP